VQVENFIARSKTKYVPLTSLDLENYAEAHSLEPTDIDQCFVAGFVLKEGGSEPEFSLVWTAKKLQRF
jgi:hypothetical protein